MLHFIMSLFGRKIVPITPKPPYPMSDLEHLQNLIIQDTLSGELTFRFKVVKTPVSDDHHYKSKCGRVHLRIDYPNMMMGSFTFLTVQGKPIERGDIDLMRVSHTIVNKKDPGPSPKLMGLPLFL